MVGALDDTRHFMSVIPIQAQASSRGARMLRTALGPEIAAWLEEPSVIEVTGLDARGDYQILPFTPQPQGDNP